MTREEVLKITCGNEAAADFVCAYIAHCHMVDDCVDKDTDLNDERIASEHLAFFEQFLFNSWARERQGALWPLVVVGYNAWLDANKWEQSSNGEKVRDAAVVKGVYHELVWFVAYLCGGIKHMRNITMEFREYDHGGAR